MLLIGRSSACAFGFSRGRQQTGTPRTGNRRSGGRVRVRRKVCVRAVKAADDLERTYVVDRYTHGPTRQIHAVALLVGLRPAWVLRCGGWASWTRDVWLAGMTSGERRRRRPAAFKLTDVRGVGSSPHFACTGPGLRRFCGSASPCPRATYLFSFSDHN
jgi:hypothetical protein